MSLKCYLGSQESPNVACLSLERNRRISLGMVMPLDVYVMFNVPFFVKFLYFFCSQNDMKLHEKNDCEPANISDS